jgi:hypothetical protein
MAIILFTDKTMNLFWEKKQMEVTPQTQQQKQNNQSKSFIRHQQFHLLQ